MAKMVKYQCVSRHGAQYRDPNGRLIFVKEGTIVITDKMDRGAKGQLSNGWKELGNESDAKDLDFSVNQKPVDEMTVAELKMYAEEKEINLGDATKKDEILAAVKAL